MLRCSGRWSHTYRSPGLLSNGPHSHPPFISIPTRDSDTKIESSALAKRQIFLPNCSFDLKSSVFRRMFIRHFAPK